MAKKVCKHIKKRKYCKIKGKWVRVKDKKEDKYGMHLSSGSPIKIKKNVRTRSGAC